MGTMTQADMENNAQCIYSLLSATGWSLAAVAGALGNMQSESFLNPGQGEGGRGLPSGSSQFYAGGLGLIQWTDYPAYTATYRHPLLWYAAQQGRNWYDGNLQCSLLNQADNATVTSCGYNQGPRWGWQQSSAYPSIGFGAYKSFSGTPEQAAEYFFFDMEWHSWPENGTLAIRKQRARNWYNFLTGQSPITPPDPLDPQPPIPAGRQSKWLFFKFDDLRRVHYERR